MIVAAGPEPITQCASSAAGAAPDFGARETFDGGEGPNDPATWLATPILHSSGRKLGELRAEASPPVVWTEDDRQVLDDLAAQLASQMELRHRLSQNHEAREASEDLRAKALAVANRIPGLVFERRKLDAGRANYTFFGAGKTELPAVRQMMENGAAGLSFVHRDDRDTVRAAILRSNLEETDLDLTFRIKDLDGTIRWVRSQSIVRREPDGAVAWDGLCFDITDLVTARDAAETARSSRETLLRNISRDLRDPLQAFVGLAQLIKVENQAERVASHARNIQIAAESMIACVDRLLDDGGAFALAATQATSEASEDPPPSQAATATSDAGDAETGGQGTGVRVLLADDLDLNRKLVADLLAFEGHDVDCVADGAQAVEAARRRVYDLILMDMIMPGMDGVAATKVIRTLPSPMGKVPIIALTANAATEHLDTCLKAGMDAALTKPVSMDELAEVVASWTRGRKAA